MSIVDFKKATITWSEDDGSGGIGYTLKYTPTESGSTSWGEGHFDVPNSGSTRHNHNYVMGWNLSPGGGRVATGSETAMGFAFEQFYQPNGSSDSFMEQHLLFVTANDAQRRPISWMMNRSTGNVTGSIEASRFDIARVGGQQAAFVFYASDGAGSGGGGQLLMGAWQKQCDIKFGYNDAPALYQLKANASTYAVLLQLNSSDELVLGPSVPVKTGQSLAVGNLTAGGIVKAEATTGKLAIVSPPTVTGSRCDNAALADLLAKLAALGIVVDETTESGNG